MVVLAVGVSAASAVGWQKSLTLRGSGAFTVKAGSRTLNNPNGVRLVITDASVSWTLACSRGFSIYSHGGTFKSSGHATTLLPIGKNPDSCDVIIAAGNPGISGGTFVAALQKR
jgi:hypothetical protein